MTGTRMFLAIIALGLLIVFGSAAYTIDETEQVVITQLGAPVNLVTDPGFHLKVPFIQTVNRFEKRFLEWDGEPSQVPTKDKRFIWVDTYARWRISDPLKFFERLRDERGAQSRLDDILDGETRSAVARHDLVEMVRSSNREPDASIVEEESAILKEIKKGRPAITKDVLDGGTNRAADLGIELLDFRFKRINYVEEVERDVFARMIAERKRIAARFRSEGEGEAARIRGERERELKRIQSEAYRTAQEVRGTADAEATQVYAEAYNRDAAFYSFTKSLETYERTLDAGSMIILTTDSELMRHFKGSP